MADELAHKSVLSYKPLDHSKRQFRLVKVTDPGEEKPCCELSTFSLLQDDLPPYKALSYRWGDDQPSRTIYIDGTPTLVRQNLSFFLTQMTTEKRQDWFFIDAICIDQSNTTEKTEQVSQMGEIFRRAEEVSAWIVYEPYHKEGNNVVIDPVDTTEDMQSKSRTWLERVVLENSYWTRLWILQEILLAKRLTIRMGNAEVEWMNLLPEKTPLTSRGLPRKNNALGMDPFANDLYANEKTAINILSYRRFETKSLRAGNHIPFHQAFDFFSLHHCSDLHDKVFGYIALTNSRIQVDYSMPILDLFISVLADFFMSTGLLGEDLTPLRKKMQFMRTTITISQANDLIVPFLAFDLNPFDPVIFMLFWEVAKFFAPGYEEGITTTAVTTWWYLKRGSFQADIEALVADASWELKYIGSACIKVVKLLANEHSEYMKVYKATVKLHKDYSKSDPTLTSSDGGETKSYSEWRNHARAISEKLWQRFLDSGEEDAGEFDDESWNLIG